MFLVLGDFETNWLVNRQCLRDVCANFMKHLVIKAQTKASIVKYSISLILLKHK